MKLQVLASVVFVCAISMPAFAQQAELAPKGDPASARAAATAAAEKLECHYEEKAGTHFKTKTCHTHEEWERMKADAQTYIHEANSKAVPMLGH